MDGTDRIRDRGGPRRIEQIDANTGEILEGVMVFVPKPRRSAFGREWFAMHQAALQYLAKQRRVLGEEGFAVFCAMAGRLDFENFIQVSQAELARELGMHRSSFSQAVTKLVAMGALIKGPRVGRAQTYRLNPTLGWKGSAKSHFGAMQEARAKGWRVFDNEQDQHEP